MGYLKDVAQEFREVLYEETPLAGDPKQLEEIVALFKDHVLESYRHGLRDAKKPRKETKTEKA